MGKRLVTLGPPYDTGHPTQLDLDVTLIPAEVSAERTVAQAAALAGQNP